MHVEGAILFNHILDRSQGLASVDLRSARPRPKTTQNSTYKMDTHQPSRLGIESSLRIWRAGILPTMPWRQRLISYCFNYVILYVFIVSYLFPQFYTGFSRSQACPHCVTDFVRSCEDHLCGVSY